MQVTLIYMVTTITLDITAATIALNTISAFDTIVVFVVPLVDDIEYDA